VDREEGGHARHHVADVADGQGMARPGDTFGVAGTWPRRPPSSPASCRPWPERCSPGSTRPTTRWPSWPTPSTAPWDCTDAGQRTFRVDRVVAAEVTDLAANQPADLDLPARWVETVDAMERRRSQVAATILVPERLVAVVRDRFGRHCTVEAPAGPGPARLRVASHTATSVAEQLAGFGTLVDVVEPAEVRAELGRIGAEIADRYDPARRDRS
jgi:WYL domain